MEEGGERRVDKTLGYRRGGGGEMSRRQKRLEGGKSG